MTTTGRRLAAALLALAALAVATGASAASPWQKLHRPLRIPAMKHGRCPVTPAVPVAPGVALLGQGAGPVFPLDAYPSLTVIPGGRKGQPWFPSDWGGGVMRFAAGPFSGPVLIRGRRLDGNERVAFGPEEAPALELHVVIPRRSANSWWTASTYTRVKSPGCYAWQFDTRRTSRVVVFRAVPSRDL
jgi:hypothetical protein